MSFNKNIINLLGKDAEELLNYQCKLIPNESIQLPSSDFLEKVFINRNPQVLRSLAQLLGNGNLGGTEYRSILPIDQGIESTAAFSFYKNPLYFNLENIIQLAHELGCNAVVSTFGVLALDSKTYARRSRNSQ